MRNWRGSKFRSVLDGYSRAKKVKADGYTFDSKMEHRRYQELLRLKRAYKIGNIEVHPCYVIEVKGERICVVELDFSYYNIEGGFAVVEDVKGRDNPLSRLKRKLVEAQYGIRVTVIKKVRE